MTVLPPCRLSFGWWNTALSPPVPRGRKTPISDVDFDVSMRVISTLLENYSIDCLALGEVSDGDLKQIKLQLDPDVFEIVSIGERDGQLQFDMGIILRIEKLRQVEGTPLIHDYAGQRAKLAYLRR